MIATASSPNTRPISGISVGDEFIGTVRNSGPANSTWVDIGAVTSSGKAVNARLRLRGSRSKDKEGGIIPVYVHALQRDSARIEVRRGSKPQESTEDRVFLDSLQVGQQLSGKVISVGKYGAVIDANISRRGRRGAMKRQTGLLQRSDFPNNWGSAADSVRKSNVERIINVGDVCDVWVRRVYVRNAFLLFDASPIDKEKMEDELQQHRRNIRKWARRRPVDKLKVGDICRGVVAKSMKFGVFVDIGARRNGLLHYSEMGEKHKLDWQETIQNETELIVEVVDLKEGRVSLKLLSVGDELLVEASERAKSATATVDDVRLYDEVKAQAEKLKSSRRISAPDNAGNKTGSENTASAATAIKREIEDIQEADAEDDNNDNDGDEEVEVFSDEYFEDKYGY